MNEAHGLSKLAAGERAGKKRGWLGRGGVVRLVLLVLAASLLLIPMVRYILHAAWQEALLLARRRPIAAVIADSATPAPVRDKLELVLQARQFAADSLGLRARQSFTTYVTLEHDTLVMVLSAAYRDQLRAVTWWFPIVGRVPYKGYFDFAAAERAQVDLEKHGFDAFVRPSPAFSTLGWFNDPVNSVTLRTDSLDLVNTVIHELTHNTYYPAGKAVFNESFANFVGSRGAEAFYAARGDTEKVREARARWKDEKTMGVFWAGVYHEIDSAFRAHPGTDSASRAARLAARDTIFRAARDSLTTALPSRVHTIPAAVLARARLDNAALIARRIYLTDLDAFDAVYAAEGDDLRRTVQRVVAIAKANPRDPFVGLRQAMDRAGALRPRD